MRRELPIILVRVIVGLVFILEGALKFLQPSAFGADRFAAIGLPFPHIIAPAIGCIEIAGGLALLLNFYAGEAAIVLMLVMIGAVVTTKIPILLGRPLGPFPLPHGALTGWIYFLHEIRLDFAMFLGALAIAIDSGLSFRRDREWYNR